MSAIGQFAQNSDTSHACHHAELGLLNDDGLVIQCFACSKRWSCMVPGTRPTYLDGALKNPAPRSRAGRADPVAELAAELASMRERLTDVAAIVRAWGGDCPGLSDEPERIACQLEILAQSLNG